jgi:hypothetical protein
MGEHRSRIGAALVGCVAIFAVAALTSRTAFLIAALLCLIGALWIFFGPKKPSPHSQWINDRQEQGNAILADWPAMKNMPDLCFRAVRWEQATYDGLVEHAPTQQARFRDENGLDSEFYRQRRGPFEYEDEQRTMLRCRLYQLAQIVKVM